MSAPIPCFQTHGSTAELRALALRIKAWTCTVGSHKFSTVREAKMQEESGASSELCHSTLSEVHSTMPPPPSPGADLHLPTPSSTRTGSLIRQVEPLHQQSHCLHRTGIADSTIRYPVWNQPKQEFPLWDGGAQQAPQVSFLESDSEGRKDERTAGASLWDFWHWFSFRKKSLCCQRRC